MFFDEAREIGNIRRNTVIVRFQITTQRDERRRQDPVRVAQGDPDPHRTDVYAEPDTTPESAHFAPMPKVP